MASMKCVIGIIFSISSAILFCKSCKGYNFYEKFLIPAQSYTKEGGVFRTKSPTEWLLRCGKRKCMNTIIEDEHCQCTTSNCVKEESEASGNPSNVQCYQTPFIPATLTPICYEAKNNQYASFTIPLKGKINSIKLQHASGGINCSPVYNGGQGLSNWGCHHSHTSYREDETLTAVTDASDQILFPNIGNSISSFKFKIPGAFQNDEELTLTRDEPLVVEKGQEMRVWSTQDLFKMFEDDNTGKHCVLVFLKFC